MSAEECFKLIKGETLENSTDHSKKRGSASTAKGFCFGVGGEEQAKKDFRRLKGIVDWSFLLAFTVKPESENRFTQCQGRYVDYNKIDSEKKTFNDYALGEVSFCIVSEYCTTNYSLEDFEEFKIYGSLVDVNKDPSDKDFLKLRDLSNPFKEITDALDFNKCRKEAVEIIGFLGGRGMTSRQALLALGISTSALINAAPKYSDKTHHDYIDAFVDILKSLVFSNNENQ